MTDDEIGLTLGVTGYRYYRLVRRLILVFILIGLAVSFILRPDTGTIRLLISWFAASQGLLIGWCLLGALMVILDEIAGRALNVLWITPVVFYVLASTHYFFLGNTGPWSVLVLYWALVLHVMADWVNDVGMFVWSARVIQERKKQRRQV